MFEFENQVGKMIKDNPEIIKAESCFIYSPIPCFVHDLFLSSYVVKTKPPKDPLFVCIRIVTGLGGEKREEKSNIFADFFDDENRVWLRDFILTKQCYLKLTIWNAGNESSLGDHSNYIYFEEIEDSSKNVFFFADDLLKKRVYPKFFVKHEEIK